MKITVTLTLLAVVVLVSCHRNSTSSVQDQAAPPDSLAITVTALNLSEDVSGNDEVLVIVYHYNDTLALREPIVNTRLIFRSKNASRHFKTKLTEDIRDKPLMFFFLEQDSELPIERIDSTLRVSHVAV